MKFSIIIPVYNEEEAIGNTLKELKDYLRNKKYQAEIIVVNDGSIDQTEKILQEIEDIKIINQSNNRGYGASIKNGIKHAKFDWILLYDGDEQHKPEYIGKLIKYTKNYDMIIGARIGYQGPLIRQPGKKLLHWTANYLAQQKIPDLNSGFRLIKKDLFLRFLHILPNGFSLSTTITLAFLKENLNVKYTPIRINKRQGKSTVKIKDGLSALMLIIRTVILFSPLRIFLPISFFFLVLSFIVFLIDSFLYSKQPDISETTVLLFISSLLFFFFGLLADQISAIRREINKPKQ